MFKKGILDWAELEISVNKFNDLLNKKNQIYLKYQNKFFKCYQWRL